MELGPCRGALSALPPAFGYIRHFRKGGEIFHWRHRAAARVCFWMFRDKEIVAPVQIRCCALFELGLGGRTWNRRCSGFTVPPGSMIFPARRSQLRTTWASRLRDQHIGLPVEAQFHCGAPSKASLAWAAIAGNGPLGPACNQADTCPTESEVRGSAKIRSQ